MQEGMAMANQSKMAKANSVRTFSCIREREADGRLALHGAWFAIDGGELFVLDEANGTFHNA